jgi:hypothetical protein
MANASYCGKVKWVLAVPIAAVNEYLVGWIFYITSMANSR